MNTHSAWPPLGVRTQPADLGSTKTAIGVQARSLVVLDVLKRK